jgi:hypothetical protein
MMEAQGRWQTADLPSLFNLIYDFNQTFNYPHLFCPSGFKFGSG